MAAKAANVDFVQPRGLGRVLWTRHSLATPAKKLARKTYDDLVDYFRANLLGRFEALQELDL